MIYERKRRNDRLYSIIPATVLYNKELKANEKLLYAIITSLACKEGYCFATNKYLAEKLDVNPKTEYDTFSCKIKKMFIKVEQKQVQM